MRPATTSSSSARKSWRRWLAVVLAAVAMPVWADVSVPLAWNASADPNVAGYKIYYGTVSQTYTNSVDVGNVTSVVIPGLVAGTTYYFAATTYTAAGVESQFSNEASYTTTNAVPPPPVYQPPTLAALGDLSLNENAGAQNVNLTGISWGNGQSLTVTAVSSNPSLIPNPVVNYLSPASFGSLAFTPVPNASGVAIITVTVDNGLPQNNLVTRSFTVTVTAANPLPTLDALANLTLNYGAAAQTVNLTGISPGGTVVNAVQSQNSKTKTKVKKLKVVATSSNPRIVSIPKVSYVNPNSTGWLKFKPAPNASGTVTINVTVTGGTAADSITRTFTVTVLPKVTVATQTTVAPASTTQVAAAPATLASAGMVNGQFSFTVTGTTGSSYVVQATTDLVNWTSVQTNAAPFVFADPNSSASGKKFYRAVSL
jgi:Fibronectin type III domain